jgi:hypothetical protein
VVEARVVRRISAPTVDPDERDPAGVAGTERYRPADRVWVYRGGAWRAGIVEVASARAATVTYRPTGSGGTAVDTLVARDLLPRAERDPLLDPAE